MCYFVKSFTAMQTAGENAFSLVFAARNFTDCYCLQINIKLLHDERTLRLHTRPLQSFRFLAGVVSSLPDLLTALSRLELPMESTRHRLGGTLSTSERGCGWYGRTLYERPSHRYKDRMGTAKRGQRLSDLACFQVKSRSTKRFA